MLLLSFILLFILVIFLLITIALKIDFIFDTKNENLKLKMLWLYPFFKAEIFMQNKVPILEVFLFNFKVFKRALKMQKNGMQFHFRDLKFEDINFSANYGFQDKFMVGIFCGILNSLSQYLAVDYFNQTPDFSSEDDFIYIRATAKLKIMPTIKNLTSHQKAARY